MLKNYKKHRIFIITSDYYNVTNEQLYKINIEYTRINLYKKIKISTIYMQIYIYLNSHVKIFRKKSFTSYE